VDNQLIAHWADVVLCSTIDRMRLSRRYRAQSTEIAVAFNARLTLYLIGLENRLGVFQLSYSGRRCRGNEDMAKTVKSPDATDAGVGEKIRTQRLLTGVSKTDLANELGITFQQVQKYEKGVNRVGAGRLQRIAEVLGAPVSFFFEGARGIGIEVENINSSLRFLESAAALRVVRAFAEIEDGTIRKAIVALIEEIAGRHREHEKKE